MTRCSRPYDSRQLSLSVLYFCDAGRTADAGQLSLLAGLLIDSRKSGAHFHVISWASHKAKRPVKSIGAAETLATSDEAIDAGKSIRAEHRNLYDNDINLVIALVSEDLYTSLTTQQQSIDLSIRGDVSVIRYEFETRRVHEVVWIPGKLNLADCGTKIDSQLTSAVNQLLQTGRPPFDLDNAESCPSEKPFG